MKSKHYSVLAVLVALLAMASVGAGSASADTLCKVNESPCPEGEVYPAGETIKATSENLTLSGGVNFKFECTANLEAVIGEKPGPKGSVRGEVTKFAVPGCKGSCQSGSELNIPYAFDLSATSGGNGIFRVTSGGKGNPGFILKNCFGLGVSCTYSTGEISLEASGGSPAVLSTDGTYLSGSGAEICPSIVTMNADFVVTNPTAAWVGAGWASADTLCKVNESPCPAGEEYPAGETIKATSENLTLSGGVSFLVQCTGSIEAVIGEEPGPKGSVRGEVTKFALAGCKGSCQSGSELNIPYAFDLSATSGGNGVFVATSGGKGRPSFTLKNCLGVGLPCTYATWELRLEASGGSPAVLGTDGLFLERTSGPCPAIATMTADFTVTNPAKAWVQS